MSQNLDRHIRLIYVIGVIATTALIFAGVGILARASFAPFLALMVFGVVFSFVVGVIALRLGAIRENSRTQNLWIMPTLAAVFLIASLTIRLTT